MKIYLGADHGGYKLKEKIKTWLAEWGFSAVGGPASGGDYFFEDLGAHSLVEGDDYPDYAVPVAQKVVSDPGSLGILACRSGQGESIAANKVKGARAALAWSEETGRSARHDDDSNILCLASDYVGMAEQQRIIRAFIGTSFGAEERFKRRIEKIKRLEENSQ